MNWRLHAIVIPCALALTACGSASAVITGGLGPVSVLAPAHPSARKSLQVSFHPRAALPLGGYYYAVLVLRDYQLAVQEKQPPCAISSNMERTAYGYPHGGRALRLTLTPARSPSNRWCSRGSYAGAIYAVPHRPPCSRAYSCYGKSTQSGGCWNVEGRILCGVVAIPLYTYPGGLPKPIDRRSQIVGRFQVSFQG
jgi:hypothetical protein